MHLTPTSRKASQLQETGQGREERKGHTKHAADGKGATSEGDWDTRANGTGAKQAEPGKGGEDELDGGSEENGRQEAGTSKSRGGRGAREDELSLREGERGRARASEEESERESEGERARERTTTHLRP